MPPSKATIGICAYNEEGNIGRLLQNLTSEQDLPKNWRILVICSGCTDRTPAIVKEFQEKDARVKQIVEQVRKGKSSALNRLFRTVKDDADVLFLVNADALPEKESIRKLASELAGSDAGAVFARPVPFLGFHGTSYEIVQVIWRLHHVISMLGPPKLSGELCAIHVPYLREIPENTATDEPYIEMELQKQQQAILYVPDAVVYTRCPTNVFDLLKQRKRIWIGHMQLQNSTGYKVSTSNPKNMLKAVAALKPRQIVYAALGGFLEAIAYFQAKVTFNKGRIPYAWEPIKSTKTPV